MFISLCRPFLSRTVCDDPRPVLFNIIRGDPRPVIQLDPR
jgi:hypothetical protein